MWISIPSTWWREFSAIPSWPTSTASRAKTSQSAAYATIERVYSPTEVDSQGQPVVESETYLKNGAEEVDKSQINAYYLGLVSPILDRVIPEDKMDQVGDEVLPEHPVHPQQRATGASPPSSTCPMTWITTPPASTATWTSTSARRRSSAPSTRPNDFAAGVAPEVDSGLDDATVIGPSVSTARNP